MTEAEWLAKDQLWDVVDGYDPPPSDRKQRLLAIACSRRILHVIPVEAARRCVEVAELFADGQAGPEQLGEAIRASMRDCDEEFRRRREAGGEWSRMEQAALFVVERVHRPPMGGREATVWGASSAWAWSQVLAEQDSDPPASEDDPRLARARSEEHARQVTWLRDIYGNPFRPVAFDPSWLTSTVVALAESIYANRAFDRLPILADALQDAGCENADLLTHLRGGMPHVRGCWALDLVLGRE